MYNEVGKADRLFDVQDFFLLLVVRLHLVHFVFLLCSHVHSVVTRVVDQFLLGRQIHDVRTDRVHEILGVRCDNEDVVIRRQVRFEPHHSTEIEMVSGFVKQKQMGFDEKCSSESHAHPPTTTHVFCGFLHHSWRESKTVKDTSCFGFECVRIKFFELLVRSIESDFIDIIRDRKLFYIGLELGDLLFGGSNNEVDGIDI